MIAATDRSGCWCEKAYREGARRTVAEEGGWA